MPLFQVLDQVDTPIGELILRRRELLGRPGTIVTEVTVEGEMLMSSHHTDSERALAREALALHGGQGLSVLVGGLGLGYTAAEALRDPRVTRVEVVELLEPPLRWLEEGLVPLAGELRADPRLALVQGDVYARLLAPPRGARFDLILIDVDHSPDEPLDPSSLPFYRPEGLLRAREHLAPGGVLAVWSTQEDDAFLRALRSTFTRVEQRRVEFWNEMTDQDVVDLLFLAVKQMPRRFLSFSLDIEAAGRIPGPSWMCSFGVCRIDDLSRGFTRRLKPLVVPGIARPDDPAALDVVAQGLPDLPRPVGTPEERAALVRAFFQERGVEPRAALVDLREWLAAECQGARPVMVGGPATFDFMWLYWYWLFLLEESPPFGFAGLDIRSYFMGFHGVGWESTGKKAYKQAYPNDLAHTHDPLDDAREQGKIWADMVAHRAKFPRRPPGLAGLESTS